MISLQFHSAVPFTKVKVVDNIIEEDSELSAVRNDGLQCCESLVFEHQYRRYLVIGCVNTKILKIIILLCHFWTYFRKRLTIYTGSYHLADHILSFRMTSCSGRNRINWNFIFLNRSNYTIIFFLCLKNTFSFSFFKAFIEVNCCGCSMVAIKIS